MTNRTAAIDIGAKLWSLCHVLRDGGVTYHQYLCELTYLLFLKMMKETGQEERLNVMKTISRRKGAPAANWCHKTPTMNPPASCWYASAPGMMKYL